MLMKRIFGYLKYRLIRSFNREVHIPSYEEKREVINGFRNKFSIGCLVETGTFLGDTVEYFKNRFEIVYSIELSMELAARAMERFKPEQNVHIIQGDSGVVLHDLVSKIEEPAIFWLDGHYSSEFFLNDEYIRTARSDRDTPIENELKAIFKSNLSHVILIDDARLFNGINDYPTIEKLKSIVLATGKGYKLSVDTDIIRIVPVPAGGSATDVTKIWRSKKGVINKEYIRKFLPENPVIIDAGAHRGDDSIEFTEMLPLAEIHAFEPVPNIFNQLKENISAFPKISCYKLALSNRTGQMEMHISSGGSDASSSLLAPRDHLTDHPDTFFNEKIVVDTITMDDWAERQKISKIDFLWLDMQGYELDVVKASPKIFKTVKAVHIEVSTKPTYENVPQYREVKEWMETQGFKVKVEEIPSGWDMGNVLFIRN
jgi:FkbM family methyltransferase